MRLDKNQPIIGNSGKNTHKKCLFIGTLDSSFSMRTTKHENAKHGLKQKVEALLSQGYECVIYNMIQRDKIEKLTHYTGLLATKAIGDNTPLNDTIYKVCQEALKAKDTYDIVLVNIFTDGEENSSLLSYRDVIRIVQECKDKGIFVTFICNNIDKYKIERYYNIENVLGMDNTAEGVQEAISKDIDATMRFSKSVANGEDLTVYTSSYYKGLNE